MGDWGNAGKGALGGGATGAAIGSVGGPWGAAIGGGIGAIGGGLLGYFSGGSKDPGLTDQQRLAYEAYINGVQNRQFDYSEFRGNQQGLVGALEAQASGRGPSMAAEQLRAAVDRTGRQQQGFANAARGGQQNLARYQAQTNMATLGAQASQDAAAARIAEIASAQNQLGGVLQSARAADEETRLRQMGLNDEAIARYYATMGQSPGHVGQGDALLAAGIGAAGTYAQQRAAQSGGTAGSGSYTPYGDNTINPFQKNPYQGGTRKVAV